MGPHDVERLTEDASVIRNRRKIEECISSALVIQDIQADHGSFCTWFYDVLDGDDLGKLHRTLRKTFKFIGTEIARMWLMATGRIADKD